jgi:hypothetical protein
LSISYNLKAIACHQGSRRERLTAGSQRESLGDSSSYNSGSCPGFEPTFYASAVVRVELDKMYSGIHGAS